jgi:hypothetical protein
VIAVNVELPVVIVADFGKVRELRRVGWTSHRAGLQAARLTIMVIDKVLSTIESNC